MELLVVLFLYKLYAHINIFKQLKMFSCKFCEIFLKNVSIENLQAAAFAVPIVLHDKIIYTGLELLL